MDHHFESLLEPEDTLLYAADERAVNGAPPPLSVTDRWTAHLGSAVPYEVFQTHVRLNLLHQNQLQQEAEMVAKAKRFGEGLRTKGHVKAMVNNAVRTQNEWLYDPTSPNKAPAPTQSPVQPLVAVDTQAERRTEIPHAVAGVRKADSQQVLKPSLPPRAGMSRKEALGFGLGAVQALDPSNAWLNALRGSFHLRKKRMQPQKDERAKGPVKPPPTMRRPIDELVPEPLVQQAERQDNDEGADVQGRRQEAAGPALKTPAGFDSMLEGFDAKTVDPGTSLPARRPSTPCSSETTPRPQLPPADAHLPLLWLHPSSPQDPRALSPPRKQSTPSSTASSSADAPGIGALGHAAMTSSPAKSQQAPSSWQQQPRCGPPMQPDRVTEYATNQQQPHQEQTAPAGSSAPSNRKDAASPSSGLAGHSRLHAARPPAAAAPDAPSSPASSGAGSVARSRPPETAAAPSLLELKVFCAPALPSTRKAPSPAPLSPARTSLFLPAAPLSPTCFPSKPTQQAPRSPHPAHRQQPTSILSPDMCLMSTSTTDQRPEEDSVAARVSLLLASPRKAQKGGQPESQRVERCRASPASLVLRPLPMPPGQWQLGVVGIKSAGMASTEPPGADAASSDRPPPQRVSTSGGSTGLITDWAESRLLHSRSQSPASSHPDRTSTQEPTRSSSPASTSGAAWALAQGNGKVWDASKMECMVPAIMDKAAVAMGLPVIQPFHLDEELLYRSPKLQPLLRGPGTYPPPLQHASSLPSRPRTALHESTSDLGALKAPCLSADGVGPESANLAEQEGGAAAVAELARRPGLGGRLAPLAPNSSVTGN